MFSFGLLQPIKGIDHVVEAMGSLFKIENNDFNKNLIYLVAGELHPEWGAEAIILIKSK